MKKILSIALALVMVLSLGVVAFADDAPVVDDSQPWDGTYAPTSAFFFKEIIKSYDSENNKLVTETLTFTCDASKSNPDGGDAVLTIGTKNNNTVDINSLSTTLSVYIPALYDAGKYEWIIKETAGSTPGVTYSTDEVHVIVWVGYDNDSHKLVILNTNGYIKGVDDVDDDGNNKIVKKNEFKNTFKSGSFTVEKHVEGNMANENDEFLINVTLFSTNKLGTDVSLAGTIISPDNWTSVTDDSNNVVGYTYTSSLKYSDADGPKVFSDIPVGVVVSVDEPAKYIDNGKEVNNMGDYLHVDTKLSDTLSNNLTIADTNTDKNANFVVTNKNSTEVVTGVSMDSIPYVVLLTVACLGLVVLLTKKRTARDF